MNNTSQTRLQIKRVAAVKRRFPLLIVTEHHTCYVKGLPHSPWRDRKILIPDLLPDSPFMTSVSQIPPPLPLSSSFRINSADWRVCVRSCLLWGCFLKTPSHLRKAKCGLKKAMREKNRWPVPACSEFFFNQGGNRNWCHRVTNRMLWL